MTRLCSAFVIAAAVSSTAHCQTKFVDSFETYRTKDGHTLSGVSGDIWHPWPGHDESILLANASHVHSSKNAAFAVTHDPVAFSGYADFGATDTSLRAEVFVYDELKFDGSDPAKPVTCMLALFGDGAGPDALTDYLELGVVPDASGRSQSFKIRTRYGDFVEHRVIETGVHRQRDLWTKLAIEVDSLDKGGEARFYIDDEEIGTSYRAGAKGAGHLKPVKFRWVRLGNSTKTYENFWYDDVSVKLIAPKKQ